MKRIIAIFLIVGGILAILSNLDIINFSNLIDYLWPSLLILLGLSGLVGRKGSFIFPSILILVGGLFLARAFGYLNEFRLLSILWPSVIILIGIGLLFPRSNRSYTSDNTKTYTYTTSDTSSKERHWNTSNQKNYTAFMSGLDERVISTDFTRISITAIMGGADIDLREIQLAGDEGYIEVNAIMGGIDIYLPTGYRLEVEGTPILGAFENHCISDPNATKTLRISYATVMGAIEIKH